MFQQEKATDSQSRAAATTLILPPQHAHIPALGEPGLWSLVPQLAEKLDLAPWCNAERELIALPQAELKPVSWAKAC